MLINKAAPIGHATLIDFHFDLAIFQMIVYVVIYMNRWSVKGL